MVEKKNISNVLSTRYASADMAEIWSPEHKIILERQLWIAVMKAQKDLGVDIPAEAIAAYEAAVERVDLDSIAQRERVTRMAVNVAMYVLCSTYKDDQVHAPALMRRRSGERVP